MNRDDIIMNMQPFSDAILDWAKKHPSFSRALKIIYPDRFITLQALSISYPTHTSDQIIGIFAYDYRAEKFKQDFIVNVGNENKEFILYTKLPGKSPPYSKYVQHINGFFTKYGTDGQYAQTHHPTLEELPEEIKSRAKKAQRLANRLKITGLRVLSPEELAEIEAKVKFLRERNKLTE